MKKRVLIWLCAVMLLVAVAPMPVSMGFVPAPQTTYASQFIAECDGQQWFIDEIERLLNIQERTINTIQPGDLDHIVTFGLHNQGIEGVIPRAFGRLTNLKHIFLGNNQLTGTIPVEILSLPKLENLDLANNQLTGAIPEQIGGLTNLKVLLLWNNQLDGAIPTQLGSMTKLENLDLANNQLTGSIPDSLGSLERLKFLSLSNNPLNSVIPAAIGNLNSLQALLMWNCGLTGSIPAQMGNMEDLQILDLAQNQLVSEIPVAFGQLTQLQRISVRENQLYGALPTELGNLADLTVLDVAHNNIHGAIPGSYGNLVHMRYFNVADNQVGGTLPDTLSQMTQLQEMYVHNNLLRGTIPDIFTNMSALESVNMSGNQLAGDVPASLKSQYDRGVSVWLERNYMAGERIAGMQNVEENFVDVTAKMQHEMHLPLPDTELQTDTYILSEGTELNLYEMFYTTSNQTGENTQKTKLQPGDYECRVVSGNSDCVEISQNGVGTFVSLTDYVDQTQPVVIEYFIQANGNLPNSTATIRIASPLPEEMTVNIETNAATGQVTVWGVAQDLGDYVAAYVEGPGNRLEYIGTTEIVDGRYEFSFGIASPQAGIYKLTIQAQNMESSIVQEFALD